MKFFWCRGIFFLNFDIEMGVKINLRIITKNHAADPTIVSHKIDFKSVWPPTAMPPAWKLKQKSYDITKVI